MLNVTELPDLTVALPPDGRFAVMVPFPVSVFVTVTSHPPAKLTLPPVPETVPLLEALTSTESLLSIPLTVPLQRVLVTTSVDELPLPVVGLIVAVPDEPASVDRVTPSPFVCD